MARTFTPADARRWRAARVDNAAVAQRVARVRKRSIKTESKLKLLHLAERTSVLLSTSAPTPKILLQTCYEEEAKKSDLGPGRVSSCPASLHLSAFLYPHPVPKKMSLQLPEYDGGLSSSAAAPAPGCDRQACPVSRRPGSPPGPSR